MVLDQIKPNRKFWDVLKGIGICCVVYGHSCVTGHNFIYAFHLPLFFFIAGFMYDEKKYGDQPLLNVINKLKSNWLKYVVIYWIILLCHNKLTSMGMMPDGTAYYSLEDLIKALGYAILGTANELMGGTLWFIPALCMASFFLGYIVYISRIIEKKTKNSLYKFIIQIVGIFCTTVVGQYLISVLLPANIQVSLTVMPFLWVGYLLRNYGAKFRKDFSIIVAFVFLFTIYYISAQHGLDLIMGQVYFGMYVTAFMGIYVCMTVTKFLLSIEGMSHFLELCGKSSFWIMAFHFPLIKIIDYIWANHLGNMEAYKILPHAFDAMWPVYIVVGIAGPLLVDLLFMSIKKKIVSIRKVK